MKIAFLVFQLATLFLSSARSAALDTIDRPTSPPYTGTLSIFEDPKRDQNLQVNRVMDLLGIHRDSSVADVGAGGGWFSVRAARRVGPRGTVYAVEINPPYVREIAARAKRENLPNVHAILSQPDDPLLPPASVDAILLLKTYHEIAHPIQLLHHLRAALKSGGRLGIIDRHGTGGDHGINANKVIEELACAGFSLVSTQDFVKADGDDYFLIFR